MKRLSWIFTLPLIIVAVAFSIANRDMVTLDLWPFALSLTLPLFVLLLVTLFVGLLVGGLASWLSATPTRRRARQARRRAEELERELAQLKRERDAAQPASGDNVARLPAGAPAERTRRSAAGS